MFRYAIKTIIPYIILTLILRGMFTKYLRNENLMTAPLFGFHYTDIFVENVSSHNCFNIIKYFYSTGVGHTKIIV